jgi:hypothetical protein
MSIVALIDDATLGLSRANVEAAQRQAMVTRRFAGIAQRAA